MAHEHRQPGRQRSAEISHDALGRLLIEVGGRLVEQDHLGAGEEGAGHGKTLTFPAREAGALRPDPRVETLGKGIHHASKAGARESVEHVGIGWRIRT